MVMINRKLAAQLEHHDAQHSAAYAIKRQEIDPLIPTSVETIGDGVAIFAGDQMPINRVIGLGTTAPVTERMFDQVDGIYAYNNTRASIDLCPLADESLIALLRQRGYKPAHLYTVLVRQLPALDYYPPESDVHVALADDAQLWTQTVSQGFLGKDDVPEDDVNPLLAHIAFMRPEVFCHIAYIDGVPAGGGAVSIQDKVAVFFSVSTRAHYRRRGVQAVLMKARLDMAAEKGCELAMSLATPGSISERNLQRGGFRVAYTKVILTL
jgi:GNAT superfamily N-acetyltransferase